MYRNLTIAWVCPSGLEYFYWIEAVAESSRNILGHKVALTTW
jgi:hypothetical protein